MAQAKTEQDGARRARKRAGRAIGLLGRLLGILLLIFGALLLWLFTLTDLGATAGRELAHGLPEDLDWQLHLDRLDRIESVLSADEGSLLQDPRWRFLLGIPAPLAPDARSGLQELTRKLGDAEILLRCAWSDEAKAGASLARDRFLLALRPSGDRPSFVVQLARSRWFFERFIESRIPAEFAPLWVDGLVVLGATEGFGQLVIGSRGDVVVIGTSFAEVRGYLEAREAAPEIEDEPAPRLELSKRARAQLHEAAVGLFGPDLPMLLGRLLPAGAGEVEVTVGFEDGGPLTLDWTAEKLDAETTRFQAGLGSSNGNEIRGRAPDRLVERLERAPVATGRIDLQVSVQPPAESAERLVIEVDAGRAGELLDRLLEERLALEEKPVGDRREELREEWRGSGLMQSLEDRLAFTLDERKRRVEIEIACWRALLGGGFTLRCSEEDGALARCRLHLSQDLVK